MKSLLLFSPTSEGSFSSKNVNFTEIKIQAQSQNQSPNDSWEIAEGIFFILIAVSLIPLLLIAVRSLPLYKLILNRLNLHQDSQQSACFKCQFFSKNMYLKCAVNPALVLTKEANDCPDFCHSQNPDKKPN